MSVGGTIVDLVRVRDDKWWVNTVEKFDAAHASQTVAVYCNPQGERLEVGDVLWWQGSACYWTPRVHPDGRSDVRLPKIGYSGVSHPDTQSSPRGET